MTVSGVPLAGSTQPATFTADLSDAADMTGAVTWLVDDSFASKTTTPPSGRFIALALIGEFHIVSALDDLRTLAARLETAEGPGAPYEWANVNRLIAQFSTER